MVSLKSIEYSKYSNIIRMIQDADKYLRQLIISGNGFVKITDNFYKDNAYGKDLEKFLHAKKVFLSDIEQLRNEIKYIQGAFYEVEQDSKSKSE